MIGQEIGKMFLDLGIAFPTNQINQIGRGQFRLDCTQISLLKFVGNFVPIDAEVEHERDILLRPLRRIGVVAHLLRILDARLVGGLRLVLRNLGKIVHRLVSCF